jgi:hypothetical protein
MEILQIILKYAAGVSSILSLLAFLAGLFVWLQSQKKERSVVDVIRGEGIVQADTVVKIVKQFKDDDKRLEALKEILKYSDARAKDVLDKVKPNVDVGKFSLTQQAQIQRQLIIAGVVLIVIGALSIIGSRAAGAKVQPVSNTTSAEQPQQPTPKQPAKDQPPTENGQADQPPKTDADNLDPYDTARRLFAGNWMDSWKVAFIENTPDNTDNMTLRFTLKELDNCALSWTTREQRITDQKFVTFPQLYEPQDTDVTLELKDVKKAIAITNHRYRGWEVQIEGRDDASISNSSYDRMSNKVNSWKSRDAILAFPDGAESTAVKVADALNRLVLSCRK